MSFFGSRSFCGDDAKSLFNLKRKKAGSVTPLKLALKSLILELNDSVFAKPYALEYA
tara:strand:+ start:659 stop:829 length:171 start_codon:yes stop_codon:yes gene_type:complete